MSGTSAAQDLTAGPVLRHLVALSGPILGYMIVQALYLVIDLYFVAELGQAAIAGVGSASSATVVVVALSQVLGVGTATLVSQAAGRRSWSDLRLVFNQSMGLAILCGIALLVVGYGVSSKYMRLLAADPAAAAAGSEYLKYLMPGLALQFAFTVMSSAMRAIGCVRPQVAVYILTVIINTILAPVLIAGWGTGRPLGAAGAGLATSVALIAGMVMLCIYQRRTDGHLLIEVVHLCPRLVQWGRILGIGTPAGLELALMSLSSALIYWIIRDLGAAAQAGFGVGLRVVQVGLAPAMAISLAAAPIAGQSFGAGDWRRVKQTFHAAAFLSTALMLIVTTLLQLYPEAVARVFTAQPEVVTEGAVFLQLASFSLIARGLILTCSSLFQGLGHTLPSLVSSGASLLVFSLLVTWLAARPDFRIEGVWYLLTATAILQAAVSTAWLQVEFKKRLQPMAHVAGI